MQAVILAAGQGSRLRPLTDYRVEVQGKPLLQYQLEALCAVGVRECVIVVGHLAAQIRHRFGSQFRGLSITYVENEIYDRTNNIYSLWLARHEITKDMLLLESDVIFEPELLADLIELPCENAAIVDRFQPPMNGTVILARGDTAGAMVLKRDQSPDFDYRAALKTVNIYKFCHRAASRLMVAIGGYVSEGLTDNYYEMAIAEAVADGRMRLNVLPTGPHAWAEVDTPEDLADAESMRYWPTARPTVRTAIAINATARAATTPKAAAAPVTINLAPPIKRSSAQHAGRRPGTRNR